MQEPANERTFGHGKRNLIPVGVVFALGLLFLNAMLWAGVTILGIAVGLTGYHLIAIRNRRLIVAEEGITYWDWRGRLKLSVDWSEVRRLAASHTQGDEGYVLLKTLKGNVNVLGLNQLDELESIVLSRLKDRIPTTEQVLK